MLTTAFLDYRNAKRIEKHRGTWKATLSLVSSLVFNLGVLVLFKYSGFFVENINFITGANLPVPSVALPIGISFYTFQTITYVTDVYRGKFEAQRHFYKYLLYLSLYFQLVAGPIVRYDEIGREIEKRTVTPEKMAYGIGRFLLGLAKKVLIANVAGKFVDQSLGANPESLSVLGAWFGVVMFTVQLYFDFSGYSDMAIGLGHMFGFRFPENFRYPYISKSVTEFWRRWHITLGSFFRDYVYIPLGGNRSHVFRNLFVVWFFTGLWHGASWNYIIWGLYNGFFIMLERRFKHVFEKIPGFFRHIYLLLIVNVGFVFFYFRDVKKAAAIIRVLFGGAKRPFTTLEVNLTLINNLFWILLSLTACLPILPLLKKHIERFEKRSPVTAVTVETAKLICLAVILFFSTASLAGNSFNPFLYFQF